MSVVDLDRCPNPECGREWDYYVDCNKPGAHGPGEHCEDEVACSINGCTPHCCGPDGKRGPFSRLLGLEYEYGHPQRYDGVSEWICPFCETRWGRWTGKILGDGEYEPRYGKE